jgi:hypothetical protein
VHGANIVPHDGLLRITVNYGSVFFVDIHVIIPEIVAQIVLGRILAAECLFCGHERVTGFAPFMTG